MPETLSLHPRRFSAHVPPDLEAVVLRCLAKNPKDRYPDTPSLAQELDACADASQLVARARRRLVAGQLELNPSEINRTVVRIGSRPRGSPVPTEELESAEVPRFM